MFSTFGYDSDYLQVGIEKRQRKSGVHVISCAVLVYLYAAGMRNAEGIFQSYNVLQIVGRLVVICVGLWR